MPGIHFFTCHKYLRLKGDPKVGCHTSTGLNSLTNYLERKDSFGEMSQFYLGQISSKTQW